MHTPEWFEKEEICEYLDSIGAWYCKPYMAGYGKRGVPDIVACINGRFVGIEVKREGGVLTMLQLRRLEAIGAAGGGVVWGTAEKVIGEIKAHRAK